MDDRVSFDTQWLLLRSSLEHSLTSLIILVNLSWVGWLQLRLYSSPAPKEKQLYRHWVYPLIPLAAVYKPFIIYITRSFDLPGNAIHVKATQVVPSICEYNYTYLCRDTLQGSGVSMTT